MEGAVERAADAMECILRESIDAAMNRYNIRKDTDERQ
jgi:hypothetical protein